MRCSFFFRLLFLLVLLQNLPKTQKPRTRRPPNATNFLLDIFFNIILNMQRIFQGESRCDTWSHQMLIEFSVLASAHSWECIWRPGRMHSGTGNCFSSFLSFTKEKSVGKQNTSNNNNNQNSPKVCRFVLVLHGLSSKGWHFPLKYFSCTYLLWNMKFRFHSFFPC